VVLCYGWREVKVVEWMDECWLVETIKKKKAQVNATCREVPKMPERNKKTRITKVLGRRQDERIYPQSSKPPESKASSEISRPMTTVWSARTIFITIRVVVLDDVDHFKGGAELGKCWWV
jgi:hypothetical protein